MEAEEKMLYTESKLTTLVYRITRDGFQTRKPNVIYDTMEQRGSIRDKQRFVKKGWKVVRDSKWVVIFLLVVIGISELQLIVIDDDDALKPADAAGMKYTGGRDEFSKTFCPYSLQNSTAQSSNPHSSLGSISHL